MFFSPFQINDLHKSETATTLLKDEFVEINHIKSQSEDMKESAFQPMGDQDDRNCTIDSPLVETHVKENNRNLSLLQNNEPNQPMNVSCL